MVRETNKHRAGFCLGGYPQNSVQILQWLLLHPSAFAKRVSSLVPIFRVDFVARDVVRVEGAIFGLGLAVGAIPFFWRDFVHLSFNNIKEPSLLHSKQFRICRPVTMDYGIVSVERAVHPLDVGTVQGVRGVSDMQAILLACDRVQSASLS